MPGVTGAVRPGRLAVWRWAYGVAYSPIGLGLLATRGSALTRFREVDDRPPTSGVVFVLWQLKTTMGSDLWV